ncbi:MAG TPA: ATP-binding protein [Puia sp.]|nr:ATP-binding protein [Puia sp.]
MEESADHKSTIQQELEYYKKLMDQMSGQSLQNDFIISSLSHQLKQKKEAFSILTTLQREFLVTTPLPTIFEKTIKTINAQLGMDQSLILTPGQNADNYKAEHWYGFPSEQIPVLEKGEVEIQSSFFNSGQYILVNKSSGANELSARIQKAFLLIYFVGVPIILDDNPVAIILAARKYERPPFVPPLNDGDADTLMAIAGLISMVIQNKKMMQLRLQKAEVEKQREAIAEQRDHLEQTLHELKKTQALLVQREKMASLGELTAGIAHEIQNPLNFVNNFSDINTELLGEMELEMDNGNMEDAKAIARDVRENEQKITHHGKRADAIVKSMLQHSRTSNGAKQLTDINALADEYLQLAFHGLRAKDKSFNAIFKTDYDKDMGSIHVVPQDIGRVFLNLYNNAFYVVAEKGKRHREGYEPTVSVNTKKVGDMVWISIKDNGDGIPPKLLDKIFQPFFTTKPTGEGTGLGLSLSYDIVKAHGGELKVETKEGKGAEFIVQIPVL